MGNLPCTGAPSAIRGCHPPRHDFIHYTPLGNFGKGKMTRVGFSEQKHGAVIHITKKEAKMLEKLWNKKK